MKEFVMTVQKLGSDEITVKDKVVRCQNISNVIRALGQHGYHVLTYHTNAPKGHIQRVSVGGINEAQ